MNQKSVWGSTLRTLAIILMGITAFFTLASGAGTTCVALAAEKFGDSMAPLAPYKWLYLLFVLSTLAVGVMGVRAVMLLLKAKKGAYRYTLLTLLVGIGIGLAHIIASRLLRGKSMPTDAVVYTTVLTLLVFLLLRLPALRQQVNFEREEEKAGIDFPAAAFTLIGCGLLALSAPMWAGASHTFTTGGFNWAGAWQSLLNPLGFLMVISGVGFLTVPGVLVWCRFLRVRFFMIGGRRSS